MSFRFAMNKWVLDSDLQGNSALKKYSSQILLDFFCWQPSNFIVSRFRPITKEAQRKKKIHVSFKISNLSPKMYLSFHHGSSSKIPLTSKSRPPKAAQTTDFLKVLLTYFSFHYSSPLLPFNDITFWPCGQWCRVEQKWSVHVVKE